MSREESFPDGQGIPAMATLALRLLGNFEVLDGSGQPVEISARKSRALLAILAVSPLRSVPRHRLANLLWSDRGDVQARSSLRQTLASLRKAFTRIDASLLSADAKTIQLSQSLIDIDVANFERLADSDSVEDLRQATELYRGELLANDAVMDAEFEDWISNERRRLHTAAVACAERLLPLETSGRRIELAARIVAMEPLKESAHLGLVLAYSEAGENGLALQHYTTCRALLKRELGIVPGPEIEALRQKILCLGSGVSTIKEAESTRMSKAEGKPKASTAGNSGPALPDRPSIAVLPFANMSDDPGQQYFADGIVEELIAALSRMNWVFVIARNSSFYYRGRDLDLKQVGRELGARYILDGSVRKVADRVRISGQLVDTSTGITLWADRFDDKLENIFDLQDKLTARVVGTISPRLERAEIDRAIRKPTASLDAYDCYLRGVAGLHLFSRQGNAEALANFYRAIKRDPDFAPAYGLAARCYVQRRSNLWVEDRRRDVAEATRLARRAVDLGKDDAIALSTAGFALADVADEVEDGNAYIDRALELNPNLAQAWLFSGWVKISLGDPETAIQRLLHAMRLSPQDPHLMTMHCAMASAHLIAGRHDEAYSWAEMAVREKPTVLTSTSVAAASAALAGRLSEARKMMQLVRQVAPSLRLSNLKDLISYLRPKNFDTWAEGLRKAGLPE